jgi:hypothetical protein
MGANRAATPHFSDADGASAPTVAALSPVRGAIRDGALIIRKTLGLRRHQWRFARGDTTVVSRVVV